MPRILTILCVCCVMGSFAQIPAKGSINGHDYVDLGLPSGLLWATCNVGAESSGDLGNYYTYDVGKRAAYSWGGGWRMPTKKQLAELVSECEWVWVSGGYKVTGPNGNSIFLPAAGGREKEEVEGIDSNGNYWSSTLYYSGPYGAWSLNFDSKGYEMCYYYRYNARSVRPVCVPQKK